MLKQPCISYQDGDCYSHGDWEEYWCENCVEWYWYLTLKESSERTDIDMSKLESMFDALLG